MCERIFKKLKEEDDAAELECSKRRQIWADQRNRFLQQHEDNICLEKKAKIPKKYESIPEKSNMTNEVQTGGSYKIY